MPLRGDRSQQIDFWLVSPSFPHKTGLETPTIHRVIDKRGKKRLIVFSGLYPIRSSMSEDDGKTWSELKAIGDYGGIVAMGAVERLKLKELHVKAKSLGK